MKFKILKLKLKEKLSLNASKSLINNSSKKKKKFKQTVGLNREIIYSRHAKSKVSQIPKMIPSFLKMFEKVQSANPSKVKEVSMTLNSTSNKPIVVSLKNLPKPSENSFHTKDYLLFEIKSGSSSSKYFVKFTNANLDLSHGFHGASEIKALDIISKAGYNVIPAHLGYVDKLKKKSFIFYEYQSKLIDAELAFKENLITLKDIKKIRFNLLVIENKVNKYLEHYNSLQISENSVIRDIYPHSSKEFSSIPVFIDFKSKKLFIYDPWLSTF